VKLVAFVHQVSQQTTMCTERVFPCEKYEESLAYQICFAAVDLFLSTSQ
jgi:hypothetical protein